MPPNVTFEGFEIRVLFSVKITDESYDVQRKRLSKYGVVPSKLPAMGGTWSLLMEYPLESGTDMKTIQIMINGNMKALEEELNAT